MISGKLESRLEALSGLAVGFGQCQAGGNDVEAGRERRVDGCLTWSREVREMISGQGQDASQRLKEEERLLQV